MTLKDFSQRYLYITDQDLYYDHKRSRKVSAKHVFSHALKLVGTENEPEATRIMASMELAGLPWAEFRPKKAGAKEGTYNLLNDCYATLAPHLAYYRYFDGTSMVLYTKSAKGEVSYSGPCTEDQFRTLISGNKKVTELLQGHFESDLELRAKLTFLDFIREIFRRLEFDPDKVLEEQPALVSWSATTPAFKVLDPAILQPGPIPTWTQFLDRIDYPETFKAYIWSVFEPTNFGRQALWIQGEGTDGKSTVLRVLSHFMGTKHTMTIGIGSYDSDFFFGQCFGKRLAIYSDCKNLQVLRKERIKSVLGKDVVSINNKYEKAFSAQVYCKLLIGSNWMPQINYNDASERTRLLLTQMDKYADIDGSGDFEGGLESEIGAFLYECKKSYADQCPKGMNLKVPEEMQRTIRTMCNAMDSILLEQFIEERLQFQPNYKVRKSDLHNSMREYFMNNHATRESGFSFNDLVRMLTQKGISPSQDPKEGGILMGVQLKFKELVPATKPK